MDIVALSLVAVVAGALTTITGFGGGLVLLLAATAIEGPLPALGATALALLAANAHRVWLYRANVNARITGVMGRGLAAGALLGAWFVSAIPPRAVHAIMVMVVGFGVVHACARWQWRPRPRTLSISAALVGVLASGAGGAGFLIGPLVLATGLAGRDYLATVAASSLAMHVARVIGYGLTGVLTLHVAWLGLVLAPALFLGNLLGDRLHRRVPDAWQRRLELGAPVVCIALALAGIG